jgi:predicted  nucleic acid-binding Zn-ribbon protein
MENLREGIKQVEEEIASIREKMKEGFIDIKEELGSMMKFSFADLEKKLNALETRIKALEKMVFP